MDNYIAHYGVKGMRWGVRRNRPNSIQKPKKKKVSDMSTDELNREINRMQKEKQYKDLTAKPYTKAGKKVVQTIIVAAALEVSKNFVAQYMKQGLSAAEAAIKSLSKE